MLDSKPNRKNKDKITFCIIHYRKLPQLKKTIKNIFKYTNIPFKIKLLNQEYLDKEIDSYLEKIEQKNNVSVIKSKKNIGCGGGRALLTKNTDTSLAMTIDDDIYVHKNWLDSPLKFLKKNPKAGSVSFPLLTPEGDRDNWAGEDLKIDKKRKLLKTISIEKKVLTSKKEFIKVDNPSSGVMLFKKELLETISWDKEYFIGFDDLDIGMQYKLNSKFEAYIYKNSKLVHDKVSKDKSKKEYNKSRRNYRTIRKSYVYFVNKWGYRLPIKEHFFYYYICLLPNSISQNLFFFWNNRIKPLISKNE